MRGGCCCWLCERGERREQKYERGELAVFVVGGDDDLKRIIL
jgi:hypothetical protein